jgi:hypothetical protein
LSFSLLYKNIKIKIYRTTIFPVVLYGCETWSLTLREERRLRVFENRVLRRIFGPKRDDVTGCNRGVVNTNDELNNNNLDWGPVPHFCPLEALQPVWLMPEAYYTIPRSSKRSYSGRQVPLASTTRGSPLAARGEELWARNGGQMVPGICIQGSFTCRKSATWDR